MTIQLEKDVKIEARWTSDQDRFATVLFMTCRFRGKCLSTAACIRVSSSSADQHLNYSSVKKH